MDRFEAWFDGPDDTSSSAAARPRTIVFPTLGQGLFRAGVLASALLIGTSLIGGAHRIGIISTAGEIGTVEPSPDPSTDGEVSITPGPGPSESPTATMPPQTTIAGALPPNDCKLQKPTSKWLFSAGFPITDFSDVETTGSLKIAVLYVEFPDAVRRSPVAELHKQIEEHVNSIYAEMSYGKLTVDLIPSADWIMMDKRSTAYNVLQQEADESSVAKYVGEAVQKADPNMDFTGVDAVAVFATELADGVAGDFQLTLQDRIPTAENNGLYSTIITGGEWWREDIDARALAHEIGHVLGLQDLYAGGDTTEFNDAHPYVGYFDFMSYGWSDSHAPTFFGWNRWRLGWISDTQVVCIKPSAGTEVSVAALQKGQGTLLVVIPLSATRAVVIESRKAIGWDHSLVESGALVYLVDTGIDTTEGPIKVMADTFGDGFDSAPLSAGEYVDALSYTITSLESAEWGEKIYITP